MSTGTMRIAARPPPRKFIASERASQTGARCSMTSSIHPVSIENGNPLLRNTISAPKAKVSTSAAMPLTSGQRRVMRFAGGLAATSGVRRMPMEQW